MTIDLILHNAQIYTVDPHHPQASAVACRAGRIVAVGTEADIMPLATPKTRRVDAQGRLVLPGLTDSHVHFLQYAIRRHQVNLFDVRDFAEVRRRVQAAVAQAEPGQWVQGWGWDENLWDVSPTAALLDEIAPHAPVVLARMDMHTWWINSAALRAANINAATPDPPNSRIKRDSMGQPMGLLREWNAIRLVEQHLPQPKEATLEQWLLQAISQAHKLGLTGIHDQRLEREGAQSWRLWQRLNRQGQLLLRVHAHIAAEFLPQVTALGFQPGLGDERLWLGHVKLFADGTLGSRTALMLAPFTDEPENHGLAVTAPETLQQVAQAAQRAGFPLSIHAIGDRAVRNIVDLLTAYPTASPMPHRIEHVQVLHPDDLPRLAQHNIVASMQPVHLMTDWATADKAWGARARYTYAFRSLQEQGTILALGSDAPVAPLSPWAGIQAAVTRQDTDQQPEGGWYPQERLTVAEALYGYTMAPAIVAGKQATQGSITSGKWADMILLSQNIFEVPASEIAHTSVEMTIFAGKIAYDSGEIR